jgi:outer membrane protein insertion porin family
MIGIFILLLSAAEFRVRSIEVTGNEYFEESTITKIMLTKTRSLFRKGIFKENVFDGDIEAVRNLYVYEGFIEASVDHGVRYDSSDMRVDIALQITEGRQHFVHSIIFAGNKVFTAESLIQELKMAPGEIFDPRKMTADNYIIRYLYDNLGYADVKVESEYRVDNADVIVTHVIDEGEIQYVGEIELVGLRYTDTSVVLRHLNYSHGDIFRYARILESQRELYKLGVFMAIRTQVGDSEIPDRKDIQILLTEKELMVINLRGGYGTRDRLRLYLGLTHNNMFGRAWQGKLEGKLSFVEQRASTEVTVPRSILFGSRVGFGFFFKRLDEIGYVTQSLGVNIVNRYEFGSSEFSLKYIVERISTYFEEGDSTQRGLLHGFIGGWLRDVRDDPFYTTRGYYTNVNLEVSGIVFPAVLPSDVDYVRPTAQIRFYQPLAGIVFATNLRAGMVKPVAPTVDVPVYKRFYCGGTSSVRGYPERGIGPVDENDNPLGGRFLGEISVEVRFPIYKVLGGVVFLDGGNIWQNQEEIDANLRWGIGVGLRVRSFLGSIRFDYGFKIGREEEESVGVLHFAIGEAF